jgi:hypothetical protein
VVFHRIAPLPDGGKLALERTWYATGMARVRAVRESLTPWEALPRVRQLDERLYDWNTTLSALTN